MTTSIKAKLSNQAHWQLLSYTAFNNCAYNSWHTGRGVKLIITKMKSMRTLYQQKSAFNPSNDKKTHIF